MKTMKIRIYLLALLMLIFSGITTSTQAAEKNITGAQQEARVMEIKNRIGQIQAMDVKTMSREQRSEIKQELKGMQKELKQMRPVTIVISLGALIIIILLLILIF
jgi:hypothetical protein